MTTVQWVLVWLYAVLFVAEAFEGFRTTRVVLRETWRVWSRIGRRARRLTAGR